MKKSMSFSLRKIVIPILLLIPSFIIAQTQPVTGTITSADDGEPLVGVYIVEKGVSNGTISDLDGKFSLNLKSSPSTLVFSMVGMINQEFEVKHGGKVNVALKNDSYSLEQLVVTGYTAQKKADLTGAVSVVNVDEMMSVPENNPIRALQGRVAGMTVTADGNPSGASTVRIRGLGTMNNNDPLYVIDGVPTKGGMHELNSSDIESIQVLRDASAASIYGSRAGNGVIVITTKQGKQGKVRVNLDTYLSFSHYGEVINMMNTEQFGRSQWQAMINSGMDPNTNTIGYMYDYYYDYQNNANPVLNGMRVPKYIDGRDGTNTMLSSDTDWFDLITRNGLIQSYNLSVSNGTDKGNYFFSLGYFDNKGTINQSNFKRYSARMNSTYKLLGDIVTIGESFSLNNTAELQAPGGVLDLALMALPILPAKTNTGDWASVTSGMLDRDNPARVLNANRDNPYSYWRLFGNTFIDVQPIKNLHLKTSFGLDYSNYFQRYLTYSYTGRLGSDLTSSKLIQNHYMKWNWTNTATYNLQADKNKIDFLLGTELNYQNDISMSAEKQDYELENPDYMWPSVGTGEAFTTGGATGYRLVSVFGKVDYTYDERYLASVTMRRDGSSRFGKDNKYATFPAFSIGWRISQESFMESSKEIISDLKLRAGWGQTGNQEIYNAARFTLIAPNYVGDTGSGINSGTAYDIYGKNSGLLLSGFEINQRANDKIKWETTTQTNIGVDFGLLDQKIFGSLEYYHKKTTDILFKPEYLAAIGEGGYQWQNGASMQNRGVEFSLGYRGETSIGLSYQINGSISGNRNKVTYLPESVVNSYGGNGTTDNILGRPINSFYGYVADGLFRTQEEVDSHADQTGKGLGRIRYKDLNNDNVIDEKDRTWIGNPFPDFEYGLNISLQYKGFDFTAFLQGVYGIDVINNVKKFTDFWAVDQLGANKGTRLLDAWSPSNPNSDIPAISYYDLNNEKRGSSYYVESGSYLKLRNAQIGYTLSPNLTKKVKMDKVRLYVSGQNLFTLKSKNFSGLDPENPNLGYPISTSFTVGLNVTF